MVTVIYIKEVVVTATPSATNIPAATATAVVTQASTAVPENTTAPTAVSTPVAEITRLQLRRRKDNNGNHFETRPRGRMGRL